jgi:transcriptional regulator with XRE-family HTH domain
LIFTLSDFKTQEQIEFAELFARLKQRGINGVEVARELQTTAQTVSYYNTGQRNPRPLTMDKLRTYVKRVCGEAPGESEADHWRSRAELAEKELAELRQLLQKLGTRPERKGVPAAVEKQLTEAQQIALGTSRKYDVEHPKSLNLNEAEPARSARDARPQSSPQKIAGSESVTAKGPKPKAG